MRFTLSGVLVFLFFDAVYFRLVNTLLLLFLVNLGFGVHSPSGGQ